MKCKWGDGSIDITEPKDKMYSVRLSAKAIERKQVSGRFSMPSTTPSYLKIIIWNADHYRRTGFFPQLSQRSDVGTQTEEKLSRFLQTGLQMTSYMRRQRNEVCYNLKRR